MSFSNFFEVLVLIEIYECSFSRTYGKVILINNFPIYWCLFSFEEQDFVSFSEAFFDLFFDYWVGHNLPIPQFFWIYKAFKCL